MELLIPGLILVALMVYASTRIKKIAAEAFEAETIETGDFVIKKPEGFLNVLNGDPRFAFEAYSKEFGASGAEDFRKGAATVTVHEGSTTDAVAENVLDNGITNVSDIRELIGDIRYRLIEGKRTDKGIDFQEFYKIGEAGGRVFELRFIKLADTTLEFDSGVELMVNSFELTPKT